MFDKNASIHDLLIMAFNLRPLMIFAIQEVLHDSSLYDDVMSDVFLLLREKQPSFGEERAFHSFLCQAAKNFARNYRRKASKTIVSAFDFDMLAGSIEEEIEFPSDRAEKMDKAIQSLSRSDQRLYEMLIRGLNLKQISQELNLTYDACRKRWSRIMQELKFVVDEN